MQLMGTGLSGVRPSDIPLRRGMTPAERRFFLDAAGSAIAGHYTGFDFDALNWDLRAVALEGFPQPVLAGTVETTGLPGVTDSFGEPVVYPAFVVAEVVKGVRTRASLAASVKASDTKTVRGSWHSSTLPTSTATTHLRS
jgi:hypothetical protein